MASSNVNTISLPLVQTPLEHLYKALRRIHSKLEVGKLEWNSRELWNKWLALKEFVENTAPTVFPGITHCGLGTTTFGSLWSLFDSSDLVFTTCPETRSPRCFSYGGHDQSSNDTRCHTFDIKGLYTRYNGKEFVHSCIVLKLKKFIGEKRIEELECFPLQYHPSEEEVKATLVKTAEKALSLIGINHIQYLGEAIQISKSGRVIAEIDCRMIVDHTNYPEVGYDSETKYIDKMLFGDRSYPGRLEGSSPLWKQPDTMTYSPMLYACNLDTNTWCKCLLNQDSDICLMIQTQSQRTELEILAGSPNH